MKKILFGSLLCSRDVNIFANNWFINRCLLNGGFNYSHLILNDGSLTEENKKTLLELPGVIIDPDPVILPDIPKPILTAKLQLFDRGFQKYGADRVIIIDADVFFYKPWNHILAQILQSDAICLRDWGSSLGPYPDRYKELFGVYEDAVTHNCNTGIYSIPKEQHHRLQPILNKHIANPFHIMEDQGIFFAAYYGMLDYITDVKCLVNGIEMYADTWNYILSEPVGAHLQGMRVRLDALKSLIDHSIRCCPKSIHLSQITPRDKFISYGLLNFGSYDFTKPWQEFPTQWQGKYVMDGMYMHGGSWVVWRLPPQCTRFVSQYICMHTGIPANCHPVKINGHIFRLGDYIDVQTNGFLKIETLNGDGSHICFLHPRLTIEVEPPIYDFTGCS